MLAKEQMKEQAKKKAKEWTTGSQRKEQMRQDRTTMKKEQAKKCTIHAPKRNPLSTPFGSITLLVSVIN